MDKEKLIIKNFGPIKSVDLDLGKITVLIGEQATGKSTIAKVLSICRYFSYIVNVEDNSEKENEYLYNLYFIEGLKRWGLENYVSENSYIFYENLDYIFEFKNGFVVKEKPMITFSGKIIEKYKNTGTRIKSKSKKFKGLIKQLEDLRDDEFKRPTDSEYKGKAYIYYWYPNENFFRLNVKKVMNNPLFIPVERGFQSISVSKDSLLSDATIDELAKINRIVRGYESDVSIKPLGVVLRNQNGLTTIRKEDEEDFYYLHQGASGYQSTIPFYLAIKYNNDLKVNIGRTFIVEEPELNLFPKAQKKLVEFFAESVTNFDNQFLLPTHSPYILSSLSNLIYAHKIGTSRDGMFEKEIENIIPKESWIDVKDISVYNLENGYAEDLVDVDECIINLEYIDSVSKFLNSDFDKILEVDIALEKAIS